MTAAKVNLNAVLPSSAPKRGAPESRIDTSFSAVLGKENSALSAKGDSGELKTGKTDIGKASKDIEKAPLSNADKRVTGKDETSYKAKDSSNQADRDVAKGLLAEAPETEAENSDEKLESLMAILMSLIADISRKTGTDETVVKDFIVENNLTSENLLDIDSWKSFVTELNGLDNIRAILTNDEAFKDLGTVSDILNSHLEEMGQTTAGMTEGVADEKRAGEALAEPEKKDVLSLGELLAKMFEKPKKVELVVSRKEIEVEETVEIDLKELGALTPLVSEINDTTGANTQSGFEQSNRNFGGDKQRANAEVSGVSSQSLFDNIAANLQKLEGNGSLPEGTTARAILEQVTNQIKSLQAPDKTSLEIMLTPETLGKVAVNVTARHGVLQAELRVETVEAKNALESQIANLKLNFENQGLKVENVSVMISENGIGRDDSGKHTGEEGKRGSKRNRNFSLDGEEGLEGRSVSQEEVIRVYADEGTGSNINLGA